MHGLAELERLNLEKKLVKSQKELEIVKEKIPRLTAELFDYLGIKTEEVYADVSVEHTKLIYENSRVIPVIINKLMEVKDEVVEKDEALGVCLEKLKGFERRLAEMVKEVEESKLQKQVDDQIIKELRHQNLELKMDAERCIVLPDRDTSQPSSTSELLAEFADSTSHPVVRSSGKRPSSSSGAPPGKKSKSIPPTSEGQIQTPNQTFFASGSVLNATDDRVAVQFIQGLCPTIDRRALQNLSDSELIGSFCLDYSKSTARLSEIISRARVGFVSPNLMNELNSLKKNYAKLQVKKEKMDATILKQTKEVKSLKKKVKDAEAEFSNKLAETQEANRKNLASIEEFIKRL